MNFLYAVLFSSGLIKIGRTKNPKRRIQQHASAMECAGLTITDRCFVEVSGNDFNCVMLEARVVRECAKHASSRHLREWFLGLSFDDVKTWINSASEAENSAKSAVASKGQVLPTPEKTARIRRLLHVRKVKTVSQESGIPLRTLYRFRKGEPPNLKTYAALMTWAKGLRLPTLPSSGKGG